MSGEEIQKLINNKDLKTYINLICHGSDPVTENCPEPLLPISQTKERLFNTERLTQFSQIKNCGYTKNFSQSIEKSGSRYEEAIQDLSGSVSIKGKYGLGLQSISCSLNSCYKFTEATSEKNNFAVVTKICIHVDVTLPISPPESIFSCLEDRVQNSLSSISSKSQAISFISYFGTFFFKSASYG